MSYPYEKQKAYDITRHERLEAAGLCHNCAAMPARLGRSLCWACSAKDLARSRANYYARTGGKPRELRCSVCRVMGHDRRRCPKRPS